MIQEYVQVDEGFVFDFKIGAKTAVECDIKKNAIKKFTKSVLIMIGNKFLNQVNKVGEWNL